MKFLGIILIVSFPFLFQKISAQETLKQCSRLDSIRAVLEEMRNKGEIHAVAVGIYGSPSIQYQGFFFLAKTITNNEAISLTKDSSACIRVYSWAILSYRKSELLKEVENHLSGDTTKLKLMYGCAKGNMEVKNIILNRSKWYSSKMVKKQIHANSYQNRFLIDELLRAKLHCP